jgi:glutaconate CoA-transferase subunit B
MDYTPQELMVAAAAREIRDGEVVFVGMRLPLIAFALARETHAPTAVGLFECGIVRDTPAPELLYTMGDGPNVAGAIWCARMVDLMGLMQTGAMHAGFIGGAEIDRYGNLNTSYIGPRSAPQVKLPGSGGAADIASLSQRLLIIMAHERRRFVARVSYITSPGYGDGAGWRERVGLLRGGPSAVITTLGVLGFDPATKEAFLSSYHPGQSPETLRANTGWDLKVAPDVRETPAPTAEELAIIRRYDPQGFWTR